MGDVTAEKVRILQEADDIFISGLREWNLYDMVWQAGVILLPVQSVGVMGDERTYENAVALRAVTSTDAMTADWAQLPYDFLAKMSNEIINKVKGVNVKARFYNALAGVSDPEQKRKIIGSGFIDVFDEEAHKIKNVKWLAQGTIYPDIIESLSITGTVIKSHHNVGGLPEKMNLKLCEPLRLLFKDEVRRVGTELGMMHHLIKRQPFPGPGLAVRILGDITAEKVRILQEADDIFITGLRDWNLYDKVWQAGVILLPVQSVGVMGDERTYENAVALRAVTSTDAMTADWAQLPYEFLAKMSNEIINKVKGVNRVVYDISSKPPATIEWE